MLRLIITEEAELDLADIAVYTEEKWGVAQQAKYLQRLEERIFHLGENPSLGKNRDDIKQGYVSYSEGKHVIFYVYDDSNLTVLSVLHERMDFERHL